MKSPVCLNCNEAVERNYCSNCGQKTDTHRITLKHFLFHDVIHGVWHLDRGILFTLKQAIARPGKAALEYIEGKRIPYYNVFYLILLLTGLGIFIESIYLKASAKFISYIPPDPNATNATLDFLAKHAKFFLLLAIPVFALNSYILFNRRKFLYSEHLIIFGMFFLGIIIISLGENLLIFTEFVESISFIADWSNVLVALVLFPYLINGLYTAFGRDYNKISFSIRTLAYLIICFLELRLLGFIVTNYLKHYPQ